MLMFSTHLFLDCALNRSEPETD